MIEGLIVTYVTTIYLCVCVRACVCVCAECVRVHVARVHVLVRIVSCVYVAV